MVNKKKESTTNDPQDIEKVYLNMKNRDLAKRLADTQTKYTTILKERDILHEELFNEKLKTNMYSNKITSVDALFKEGMQHIVGLSHIFTSVLVMLASSRKSENASAPASTSNVNSKQKTHAVKPMVFGHTISHPTIKLSRISQQAVSNLSNAQQVRMSQLNEEEFEANRLEDDVSQASASLAEELAVPSTSGAANAASVSPYVEQMDPQESADSGDSDEETSAIEGDVEDEQEQEDEEPVVPEQYHLSTVQEVIILPDIKIYLFQGFICWFVGDCGVKDEENYGIY